MGIAIIYWFIAIWVSVNGISSPFDDALSFFMWAAVLVPVVAGIFLCSTVMMTRKIETQHSTERRCHYDW